MKHHLMAGVICLLACASSARAETFAAQDPYTGGVGPVVHSTSEAKARKMAVQACKRMADTCADRPVSAQVGVYTLFVTTCCKVDGQPRCHSVAVAEDEDVGRERAFNVSLKAFTDAGLSIKNCWRHRVYSVRSGARLRE